MKASGVRKLKWVPLEDWSELYKSSQNFVRVTIHEKDVNAFVRNVARQFSEKVGMSYLEFLPIFTEKNEEFYFQKEMLYHTRSSFSKKSPAFQELQAKLLVPKIED